jgi:hypothetical protein
MFKKFNVKTLSVVFVVLLIFVILSLVFNKSNRSSGFKAELVNVDTSKITSISIASPGDKENVDLKKTEQGWKVSIADKWYNANTSQIESLIDQYINLRATRVAAKDKGRWTEFHVNDSLGTRVRVFEGDKITSDIYLGKFSFRQMPNASPYMRQQPQMFTFVRLADEKEVYSTEGMLGMSFNRPASDFRDKKIVAVDKSKVNNITVNTPQGNFTITQENGSWLLDGLVPDSLSITKYISGLSHLNGANFVDASTLNTSNAAYSLTIQGNGMSPVEVNAFVADSTNGYAIESSLNKGSFFSGNKADVFEKLFPEKEKLFGNKVE